MATDESLEQRYAEPAHRSVLFVPGIHPRMFDKAAASGADAIWIDLEDAVAPKEKDKARTIVEEGLSTFGGSPVYVRVNGLASGATLDDLRAVVKPGLKGVVLPKTSRPEDVHILDYLLSMVEERSGVSLGETAVIPTIEGVDGITECRSIFRASRRITGVLVGVAQDGDTQRELGYQWTPEGHETLFMRSLILVEAKAARLSHVIEGPYVRHQDDDGLRRDARIGRQLGYTGKAAIHPRQVDIINGIYSPDEAELAYYRALIEAMERAYDNGSAAITFQGKLVDTAMLAHARQVVSRAE